jgi:hypothetical protein
MTPGRTRWPSVGFLLVCGCYALVLAFFAWGFCSPDLDRVWTLEHRAALGQIDHLSRADRALLSRALARYPALAAALRSGPLLDLLGEGPDREGDRP